jgi:uncharacterized protein (DUF433 family)
MKQTEPVIHSDPEIVGGTPVFVGTRVPLATLLDYLEAGQPLSEFLEDFPTVTREQAVAALAQEALLARARLVGRVRCDLVDGKMVPCRRRGLEQKTS